MEHENFYSILDACLTVPLPKDFLIHLHSVRLPLQNSITKETVVSTAVSQLSLPCSLELLIYSEQFQHFMAMGNYFKIH